MSINLHSFKMSKTIICDIDGTLVKHKGDICSQHLGPLELLPGVKDKLIEWDRKGFNIILLTGRRPSVRQETEKQLSEAGILYDQLIMGVKNYPRVLINDTKPNSEENTAFAYTVVRNEGIKDIDV